MRGDPSVSNDQIMNLISIRWYLTTSMILMRFHLNLLITLLILASKILLFFNDGKDAWRMWVRGLGRAYWFDWRFKGRGTWMRQSMSSEQIKWVGYPDSNGLSLS